MLPSLRNIIQKLAGSSWGSSALSLVYSTAEYCCPVWSHSTHVKKVDTTINSCLRLITRTRKSTPLPWLPVLANILPSSIRRNGALAREAEKIYSNLDVPIHLDLVNRTGVRLMSRKPFWMKISKIDFMNFEMDEE